MDFFQRLGNFFGGKGWVSDEERKRKEQQVAPPVQTQKTVTFNPPQNRQINFGGVNNDPFKQRPLAEQFGLSKTNTQPSIQDTVKSVTPTTQSVNTAKNDSPLVSEQKKTPMLNWSSTQQKANTQPPAQSRVNNPYNQDMFKTPAQQIIQQKTTPTPDEQQRMPKMLNTQGQQAWLANDRKTKQVQAAVNKGIEPPKKPGFIDYLNPLGEYGLFGARQQKLARDTIEKPITNTMKSYESWVDSSDREKGFQWNNPGDYLRFGAKLPSGMVTGVAEAPRKGSEAISGVRVNDNNQVEKLNTIQRLGAGLDAGISVGGLTFGGSGTLIRSLFGQGAKQVVNQGVKQGAKQILLNGAKNIAKDAAKEGLEEGVQTFAQDLSDDGKINTDWRTYRDAAALGALGGGMMHGAGKGVDAVHNAYRAMVNPYGSDSVKINRLHPNQMKYNAAEVVGAVMGDTRKRLGHAAFQDLQKARTNNPYKTGDGMDVELSKSGNRKYTSTGARATNENFIVKQRLAPKISEVIAKSRIVDSALDTKNHNIAPDGFDYREVPVRYRGKDYTSTIDIAKNSITGRNTLYEGNVRSLKEKSHPGDLYGAPRGQAERGLDDFSTSTVAQSGDDVNRDTQGIPQFIREAAHKHGTAQDFVKDQEENLLAYTTDKSAVDAGHKQWIKNFVSNPSFIQNVAEGKINFIEFPNGDIVAIGSHDALMRLTPEYAKEQGVTHMQEVYIGRGKTGKASSGQQRLILTGKMSLDDVVRRNIAFEQHVALYEQLRQEGHTPDDGDVNNKVVEAQTKAEQYEKAAESLERQGLKDLAEDIDVAEYVQDMNKQQALARKGERPTIRERWQDFKEDMREKFVDRFAPIEDRIANESERLEMRTSLDRVLRADGIAEAFVKDNHLDKVIHSFKNKQEMHMFDQALIAKHAIELEKNGVVTGRDIAKDKTLIREADKIFSSQFAQVRSYSDAMLQQTVDYGLISQETADYLRKKYPEYVPFDRIFSEDELTSRSKRGRNDGEASLSKQDIVQRIKGSTRQADSPLNALVMKTQDMVQQGERNMTAKLLASYADDPKNPFQLRELRPGEEVNGRSTISYLDAGKRRTFLAAPEVARAAKNMNREQMNVVLQVVAIPARVLRMGATSINAGFTMANVVKDYVGATINSKSSISAMNPKTFIDALGAAFHHNGKTYLDMQRAGVLGNSYEIARNASQLNLADIRSHRNVLARGLHNLKSPLKTLENAIGRSEDFGRAMQFISNKKAAMRRGMSEADAIKFAADQARWNSTNFMRHGTYGQVINAIVPYSNAGIQGQRILLRRFKENPVRYTAKVMLGIVAPTVGALVYSYSSDEGKEVMKNLPDYVKDNNVVIVSPWASYNEAKNRWDGVYLMPVPPQYLPLHRQVHALTKQSMTHEGFDPAKLVGDSIEQATTVNPLDTHRTAAQYTPQVAKPFVESWANKNLFTGQQIVPDSMKNFDPKDQWDDNTSLTARKVGELTGLSPKKIDNAFRTSTAGGGQNLLHSTDWAIAKATGASDDEIKGRSMMDSIVGRFYGPKGTSKGSYYYESLDKAAKDNKLVGSDLEFFQALTTRKFNENGRVEGKTDGEAMRNSQVLAKTPSVAKAISDAARWRAEQTGEELDPLYKLPLERQQYYYHIQGTPKNSADQINLKNSAGDVDQNGKTWLDRLQAERSSFFERQNFKSENSNRIPYPEASEEVQAALDHYNSMKDGAEKWAFLDAHPELGDHWKKLEEYGNKVREAQGYAPQRTRPQASEYVKMQMANKNWRDPAVSKYLQDMNIYNITNSASLAEIQGNELDPKALKAIQKLGKYGLVKNPDGTFALKYADEQGTGVSNIQSGAYDPSGYGWGGYRRRRGSSVRLGENDAAKAANNVALSLNSFARNSGIRLNSPQFSGRAVDLQKLLRGRSNRVTNRSRAVTFH